MDVGSEERNMTRFTIPALLMTMCIGSACSSLTKPAAPVFRSSQQELADRSDLIVIVTAKKRRPTGETRVGQSADPFVMQEFSGIELLCTPTTVLKGTHPGATLSVTYFDATIKPRCKIITEEDVPKDPVTGAIFTYIPGPPPKYLLLLKEVPAGKYGPVGGPMNLSQCLFKIY
jgi:hypothetical protein